MRRTFVVVLCVCAFACSKDQDARANQGRGDADAQVTECGVCLVPTPVCDETTKACVGCVDNGDCSGAKSKCGAAQVCVACLAKADCVDPAASVCGETNECEACGGDGDCTHIDGKPHCEDGVCKACTIATEAADCGDNSCNPATGVCTTTERGSVGQCESCVADSECGTDFRCIPMNYMGTARGGYCLGIDTGACARPFAVSITAVSLSGAPSSAYCGIEQSLATCEAVLGRSDACASGTAAECGTEGAACKTVDGAPNTCTYACGSLAQCDVGLLCVGGFCG